MFSAKNELQRVDQRNRKLNEQNHQLQIEIHNLIKELGQRNADFKQIQQESEFKAH